MQAKYNLDEPAAPTNLANSDDDDATGDDMTATVTPVEEADATTTDNNHDEQQKPEEEGEEEAPTYSRAEIENELAEVSSVLAGLDAKIDAAVTVEDYDLADTLNTELMELKAQEEQLRERLAHCAQDDGNDTVTEAVPAAVAEAEEVTEYEMAAGAETASMESGADEAELAAAAVVATSSSPGTFEKSYTLGDKVGEGSFSVVREATHNSSGDVVAVKIVQKSALSPQDRDALESEIAILKQLAHPNIMVLREHFEDENAFYLVTEFLMGGELFDRIVEKEFYSEREARNVVRLLLSAVSYCHDEGIVHRDLKPENLLLTSRDDDLNIKIGDFGFAIRAVDGLNIACGTPGYVAPEILRGDAYGLPVDIWAMGVITYILLCGYPPFHDDNDATLFKMIKKGEFEFESPYWDHVTDNARKFIERMLVLDPSERATAQELLADAWIVGECHVPNTHLESAVAKLKSFNARRKFRAAVQTVKTVNRLGALFTDTSAGVPDGADGMLSTDTVGTADAAGLPAETESKAEKENASAEAEPAVAEKGAADAVTATGSAVQPEAEAEACASQDAEAAEMQKIIEEAEAAVGATEVEEGTEDEAAEAAPADSTFGGMSVAGDNMTAETVPAGSMFGGMNMAADHVAAEATEPEAAEAAPAGSMFSSTDVASDDSAAGTVEIEAAQAAPVGGVLNGMSMTSDDAAVGAAEPEAAEAAPAASMFAGMNIAHESAAADVTELAAAEAALGDGMFSGMSMESNDVVEEAAELDEANAAATAADDGMFGGMNIATAR